MRDAGGECKSGQAPRGCLETVQGGTERHTGAGCGGASGPLLQTAKSSQVVPAHPSPSSQPQAQGADALGASTPETTGEQRPGAAQELQCLRAALESLTDGFCTVDAQWRFTIFNGAARQMLALPAAPLGATLWETFPHARGTDVDGLFSRVMAERVALDFETFYQPLAIWVRVKAFPSGDGIGVSFSDITEARRAQQSLVELTHDLEHRVRERTAALERVNKDLAAFSYTVAHDLRAPLGAIAGFSRALAESAEQKLGPRSSHYLQRIEVAARRMNDMTQAVLSLCSLSRAKLESRLVNLSLVASECFTGLQEAEPGRGSVECKIQPSMWARCDAGLMQVALQNLMSNAWKYSSKSASAKIQVGTQVHGDGEIAYFVRDNGVGFDPAESEKIFEPFHRLHEAEFAGSGIGLATVAKIIQRHGGKVWAESSPGCCATFYFSLGSTAAQP